MKQLHSHGDHLILTAVASLYKVQIVVMSTLKCSTLISYGCHRGEAKFDLSIPCLFIGHFAEGHGDHYVSLEHPLEIDLLNFCSRVLTKSVKNTMSTVSREDIQVDKPDDISENSRTTPLTMTNDLISAIQ